MLRLEVGFDARSGVLKFYQETGLSRLKKTSCTGLLIITFAWAKKIIGKRKSDQAAQSQDEEGEELSLK